jgi:hypothetical protein
MIMMTLATPSSSEAQHRIEEWFSRGYVFFSDVISQSTHLIRVEEAGTPTVEARSTQR